MNSYPKKNGYIRIEFKSMKNVLVTGGLGFIGSHLCKRLLNDGNKIICLDNLFTGSKNNISDLFDHSDFEFVFHDIIKPYYREGLSRLEVGQYTEAVEAFRKGLRLAPNSKVLKQKLEEA